MTTEAVYQFAQSQNKPFNFNDVVSSLSGKSKTTIQQSLDKLVSRDKLFEKTYGKQKVYCLVQENKHSQAEMMRLTQEYQVHENELTRKCQELDKEVKKEEEEVAVLRTGLTLEEAIAERDKRLEVVKKLEDKLEDLKTKTGSKDMAAVKKEAQKKDEIYSREYTKRKRMCNDVLEGILEGFPGSKKQLYEDIGIEVAIVK